jgi:uncharacterized HhH-GPD family protein
MTTMTTRAIHITGEEAADQVLTESPFALLAGMMLDQQYPMEHAFRGPYKVTSRFGSFEPGSIAAADPDEFKALCSTPPAIHRFPGAKAAQVQELARLVTGKYDGDVTRMWTEAKTGAELHKRLTEVPGVGDQTARILIALLAKQLGVQPTGWRKAAGDYALKGYRSVADVVGADSLDKVRKFKQAAKAKAKAAEVAAAS